MSDPKSFLDLRRGHRFKNLAHPSGSGCPSCPLTPRASLRSGTRPAGDIKRSACLRLGFAPPTLGSVTALFLSLLCFY
ncbi:hypothetical protein [Torque teno equus virus 1]|uniref:Uncharacterized protein n=1 Tax=Torque teno equus virus 1 TaxID=1673633 RepID=A0A0H4AQY9_9VIRU|nr:hypothetical protein [Torque teno equus virus 1]AKN50613.1 hypothetical protein [Torque teno equus virus 1]